MERRTYLSHNQDGDFGVDSQGRTSLCGETSVEHREKCQGRTLEERHFCAMISTPREYE
jgi:hypothetical protein